MFAINKIITIAILLGCVATIQADAKLKHTPSNPNNVGVLKQLKSIAPKSGDLTLYAYTCSVGQNNTASLGCIGRDSYSWPNEQDVELTVWCDKSNVGGLIAYAEVEFVVSTQNVACAVSSGGIGQSSLELKINVWGTSQLEYASYFYV